MQAPHLRATHLSAGDKDARYRGSRLVTRLKAKSVELAAATDRAIRTHRKEIVERMREESSESSREDVPAAGSTWASTPEGMVAMSRMKR